MKMKLSLAMAVVLLCLAGCGERTRVSRENNSLTAAYVAKMDKGETTPDQDKRFIRAVSKAAFELDRNIRGPKKAQATRSEAQALATGAGSLDSQLNLDK